MKVLEKVYFLILAVRVLLGCCTLMDQTAITAASGLRARMEALDMLANNLANSTTGGYKLDREFYSLFGADDDLDGELSTTKLPVVQKQWTDFGQGILQPTGNSLRGKWSFRSSLYAERLVSAFFSGRVDYVGWIHRDRRRQQGY
jgi:hypothetical protein